MLNRRPQGPQCQHVKGNMDDVSVKKHTGQRLPYRASPEVYRNQPEDLKNLVRKAARQKHESCMNGHIDGH